MAERIYDWNQQGRGGPLVRTPPRILDETIRDGLQSPSARDPSIEQKMELLRLMARLGIDTVDLGLPGAGPRAKDDVERLLRCIVEERLPLKPNCAARTVTADIRPIVEISQRVGVPVEVTAFIGSSPLRAAAEGWSLDTLVARTRESMRFISDAGLPASFVTEDTTRSHPEVLSVLFRAAIDAGATRLVLCDTCGHATPDGARRLVRFVREVARERGRGDVKIDWHGHQDRGLAVVNSIAAYEAGADRLHAAGLGVGERSGNCPMDQLLVNLKLLGYLAPGRDLTGLPAYARAVSRFLEVPIPNNYPVVGHDAFETGTGVHAAAVIKALKRGDTWLANRVYSGVPADEFGLAQVISIGPMSGKSNVVWWLEHHGYPVEEKVVDRLFEAAKAGSKVLTDDALHDLVAEVLERA